MSAEDYEDVPGLGSGRFGGSPIPPKSYQCFRCGSPIKFKNKKPLNNDGTPHRCIAEGSSKEEQTPQQATLFAMAAMNAIINSQIQVGGIDFIHHMNFQDVADAAWRAAEAMIKAEKNYRYEFVGNAL